VFYCITGSDELAQEAEGTSLADDEEDDDDVIYEYFL
jgi:hypothetical protein